MSKKKLSFVIVFAVVILTVVFVAAAGCTEKKVEMPTVSDIEYLDEIKETGNLKFEWLAKYSPSRPTAIIFHGEGDGRDFSATLDEREYTTKAYLEELAKTDLSVDTNKFVVQSGMGYRAEGLNFDLAQYWTKISDWNLAIFHWEDFAVEQETDDIIAKFYSVAKMRYVTGENTYETTRVPHRNLTEIVSVLYNEEMKDKANGKEIRFIGNGVGANLALSVASYLSSYVADGAVDSKVLPSRLALCDPYIGTSDLHLPNDSLSWKEVSTKEGAINVVDKTLDDAIAYGAVAEVIESAEVTEENDRKVLTYAYDTARSEKAEESYKNIKAKSAYLQLRENYSLKFSEGYKALKRVALDWYLYSIIGSDDSGNTDGGYAMGYPRNLSDFQNYYTYEGFNWAPNQTRPMLNNRALNNDGSTTTVAGYRGKNYSVSAWTPTTYVRALRGISFTMQKKVSETGAQTNVHGNTLYPLADYTLQYFRSENFQVSDQTDYTLVCGYIYVDTNGNGYMDDGFNGLANAKLQVKITTTQNSVTQTVATFETQADENGFYVIRFNDKKKDSEGELSKEGYVFTLDHKVTLTLIPSSHDYYGSSATLSGPFYNTVNGHNFNSFTCDVTVSRYYADGIKISNCLVRPNETTK